LTAPRPEKTFSQNGKADFPALPFFIFR